MDVYFIKVNLTFVVEQMCLSVIEALVLTICGSPVDCVNVLSVPGEALMLL